MPGPLLHLGASVLCAHGGTATPTAPNPRVLVSGQPSVVMAAAYVIAGCPFNVAGAPGERVMRPDFGSGLMQLVFAPNSTELAATTQFLVQAALQQYLGNLIALEAVEVEAEDSTLRVTVRYAIVRTQTRQVSSFERAGVLA